MRLHTEYSDVERSGVSKETAFTIKTTAKAFNILSSGLYTDKILAVVRELSCNAYDAHVAAGKKDIPFEIHLPNDLEPWFHVKDFGVGLSDDQVMNLYTTYFDSTKTESNDFIGALGLGSKSPFSYVTSFEVIARHNSMRRIYSVFLNEHGIPTIAKLGEHPTDESNGLEVRITVNKSDFSTFEAKTAGALMYFPVKPKVIGKVSFKFSETPVEALSGDGWRLTKRSYSYNNNNALIAVQGNVAYQVQPRQLNIDSTVLALLGDSSLTIFFDIGQLEVAASREEIQYDPRTKQALIERIEAFQRNVITEIEKRVDEIDKSFWYTIIEIDQLSRITFGSGHGLLNFIKGRTTNDTLIKYCESSAHVNPVHPHVSGHEIEIFHQAGKYNNNKRLKKYIINGQVQPAKNIAVFVDDVIRGSAIRLKEFLRTTAFTHVLVIREKQEPKISRVDADGKSSVRDMTKLEMMEEYNRIVEALGSPDLHFVSIHAPKPQQTVKYVNRSLPVFSFGGTSTSSGKERTIWKRVSYSEIDEKKAKLYVPLEQGTHLVTTVNGNTKRVEWTPRELENNISTVIRLVKGHFPHMVDISKDNVYAVGAQALKKIENKSDWTNVFDVIRDLVVKHKDGILFFLRYSHTSNVLSIKGIIDHKSFVEKVSELNKDSVFRKIVEPLIDQHKTYKQEMSSLGFLANFDLKYGSGLFASCNVVPFYEDNSFKCYPMFSFVGSIHINSYNSTNLDILFDYIKLTDGSQK